MVTVTTPVVRYIIDGEEGDYKFVPRCLELDANYVSHAFYWGTAEMSWLGSMCGHKMTTCSRSRSSDNHLFAIQMLKVPFSFCVRRAKPCCHKAFKALLTRA